MRGQQRWVGIGGFHGGGLALKNELGAHFKHEMPGGEEHSSVAAGVHDDVLHASGEPPAFEQRQHLAACLVDVGDAIGDCRIVQFPLDLLLAQFSECPSSSLRPLLPELAIRFLHGSAGMASGEAVTNAKVSPGANSGGPPRFLIHSTICCRRVTRYPPGPGQLRVPGSAGDQEWYWTLAGGVDVRVLDEGWEIPFREADTLRHGPVALDAGKGAKPLLHLRQHVRLAPLCTGLNWLVIASTIASTIVSCRWLVTLRVLLPRSRCPPAQQRALRLRQTSPRRWWKWRQLFDTADHGVDELNKTLSQITATGGPPNTTCADTWPWEQESCRL